VMPTSSEQLHLLLERSYRARSWPMTFYFSDNNCFLHLNHTILFKCFPFYTLDNFVFFHLNEYVLNNIFD
jgi:hypothetical protein